jgi:hypothetical protein
MPITPKTGSLFHAETHKMAKLDFFSRYPDFFEVARAAIAPSQSTAEQQETDDTVESAMVRHHYGPWDKRYYHVRHDRWLPKQPGR